MPVELRVNTDGNPETKTVEVVGGDSNFTLETFGRPRPNGVILDPNNHLLKSSPTLRVRAAIARGEEKAEMGQLYEAVQHYQSALDVQGNNSLAQFRMGEAFFYQKNYQAAANAFRDAQLGDLAAPYKWVEVWSYIYLGKIFDISGQRERALNEYRKAQETNDDTGGAQAEAERLIREPYQEDPRRAGRPATQ
jgi:tetratricopeptide (TPR) repeat protein